MRAETESSAAATCSKAAGFSAYARNVLYLDPERSPGLAAVLEEKFSRAGSAHALYITQRMRCFTLHGLRLWIARGADYRLPFLDNQFQELLFALPTALKRNNRLYRTMLLTTFPDYFNDIPWQATGLPLTWPMWAARGRAKLRGLRRRLGFRSRGRRTDLSITPDGSAGTRPAAPFPSCCPTPAPCIGATFQGRK